MAFNKDAATDKVIDGIPCMHLLNILEFREVVKFFGIDPENETDFLRRVGVKIYLRLDLPNEQLEEVWKRLQTVNPIDRP